MELKKITREELNKVLRNHKLWLKSDGKDGERAVLTWYDLSDINLSHSKLSYSELAHCDLSHCKLPHSDLSHCKLFDTNLSHCNLSHCNLSGSDLQHVDLFDSNLSGSNLSGANIDYSCLPLWCGSLKAHFDDKQIIQIIYHAVKAGLKSPNVSDGLKRDLCRMIPVANRCHLIKECGIIKEPEGLEVSK